MHQDIKKILLTREEIYAIVYQIAKEIDKKYSGKEFVLIGILNGAWMFLADLARELGPNCSPQICFMKVSSYGNSHKSSGELKIIQDVEIDLKGKRVIIVEDIVDTGLTMKKLINLFEKRGCGSVEVCVFADKKDAREVKVKLDYVGCEVPREFIVGYGLDYAQKYRNLSYLGILKEEVYM